MRYGAAAVAVLLLLGCEGATIFDPPPPVVNVTNPATVNIRDVFITDFGRRDPLTGQQAAERCWPFQGEFFITQVADEITIAFTAWPDDTVQSPTQGAVFQQDLPGAILKENTDTGFLEFLVSSSSPAPCLLPLTDQCSSTIIARPSSPCCEDWDGLVFINFTGEIGSFVNQRNQQVEIRGRLDRFFDDGSLCESTINF